MAGGIFISYRREDAPAYAGRLYDRLVAHFGTARVFMDVEGIEPGTDFVDAIERAVGACEILIVVIGQAWLGAAADGKRRLDDPADFVRLETATALKRNIRAVPVLVEGATMPRANQLPADLAPLARRQAVEINHRQWDATSGELIATLEKILGGEQSAADVGPSRTPDGARGDAVSARRRLWPIAVAGVAAAAIAAAVYFLGPWGGPQPPSAALRALPANVGFGDVPLHSAAAPATVTLHNDGPGRVRVDRVQVEGANAANFALADDGCSGRELAPNGECAVKVAFNPDVAGTREGALSIAHDGVGATTRVALQGAGTAPVVAEAKRPLDEQPKEPAAPPTAKDAKREAAATPPAQASAQREPVIERPRIVQFQWSREHDELRLCYGVENAASATISPRPGAVKASPNECVALAASSSGPFTLEARNASGAVATRKIVVDAPPPVTPSVAETKKVPNLVGKTREQALAELEAAGLAARIVEASSEWSTSPPDSVVAQLPKGGERAAAGERVTLHVRVSAAPQAALAARLPRAGDRWQYRVTSVWRNVEPRTYSHQVSAVSEREVRESMSVGGADDARSTTKAFTPSTTFVEWRGNGFYVVEFNPFLQAFDALSTDTSWRSIETPIADPSYVNWFGRGRVVGWENVSVPAGSFKALRVEFDSSRKPTGSFAMRDMEPQRIVHVCWYAAEVKRTVKQVRTVVAASGRKLDEDTFELVKYTLQ